MAAQLLNQSGMYPITPLLITVLMDCGAMEHPELQNQEILQDHDKVMEQIEKSKLNKDSTAEKSAQKRRSRTGYSCIILLLRMFLLLLLLFILLILLHYTSICL